MPTTPQNRALWLKSKQSPVQVVDSAPYSPPGPDELVIKVSAVGIGPGDWGVQHMGIIVSQYPCIIGSDVAGTVEELGSNVTGFKIGERVIGQSTPIRQADGDGAAGRYRYAGFQHYVVLQLPFVARLPERIEFKDGVVLPLAINVAASCLFWPETLGLGMPPKKGGEGKTLIVWGASSSVGSAGVQLAAAAGYEVVGIASGHNHAMVKALGAERCFDQKDENVGDEIVKYLEGKTVVGAYDATAKPEVLTCLCDVLDRAGGNKVICTVRPGSAGSATKGVKIVDNFVKGMGPDLFNDAFITHIWQHYMEKALESGELKPAPPAEVVGHGLEHVQKAIDLWPTGLSAKKQVVTL